MDTSIESFGYLLKRYRKALDLTQAELGRRAGCSEAAIRKIEAGERRPSAQLAELLADQLKIPADQRAVFLQMARHIIPERPFISASLPVLPVPIPLRPPAQGDLHNLPSPMTSLVGRVREIQAIIDSLKDVSVRLLTLVGPPGIGKTRLSLRCGQAVQADFRDGVWFVDLSAIHDSTLALPAIARALPMSRDVVAADMRTEVIQAIKDHSMLLILDNFEHVVDRGASDLVEILKACPGVKALVTSRLPLHVYGEHEYPVPALSIPPDKPNTSLDSLAQYEAVELFLTRIRQHTPGFMFDQENAPQIVEICRRMEGIPLAIELAAATARRMTLREIVQTVRQGSGQGWLQLFRSPVHDLPPRQRTLYGAIAWSYNLLDPSEQTVFRRLGVFSGSFDTEAVMAICQEVSSNRGYIESALEKLVDQYLLSQVQENASGAGRC